jgi:hypothetical protein
MNTTAVSGIRHEQGHRFLRIGTSLLLLAVAFMPATMASQLYADQENQVPISASWSAVLLAPIGQEFVPDRPSVDAVELWLANSDSFQPFPVDVTVNIRDGSIVAPVLGTSGTVSIPYATSGVVHFDFPVSVHVRPGGTYVIEIVAAPGGGNLAAGGGWLGRYSAGRLIIAGEPTPSTGNDDLWFREGPHRNNNGRRAGQ